jgi:CRP-like cAMP-binding protein
MAIVHEPKVETRVHILLWTLAERWGKVRPDGVALALPLTHALLADMVAASRPAVSAAAAKLARRGYLRRERRLWLLRGGTPPELEGRGVGLPLLVWQSGQAVLIDALALAPI